MNEEKVKRVAKSGKIVQTKAKSVKKSLKREIFGVERKKIECFGLGQIESSRKKASEKQNVFPTLSVCFFRDRFQSESTVRFASNRSITLIY